MPMQYVLTRVTSALIAVVFVLAFSLTSALAATEFEGTWNTQDTKGNPLKITLSDDGKATGDREEEGLTGTWKAEGDSAVINWDSGWVTKIIEQSDKFQKQAFEKGDAEGTPTHTADAQKEAGAGTPSDAVEAPKKSGQMQDAQESQRSDQPTGEIRYVTKNRSDLWRASKLEGVNVYNQQDEHVGDISEVLVNKEGQVEAVVIGVGGFLGIGQRDVAVPFNALEWVIQDRSVRDKETRPAEERVDRDQDVADRAADRDRTAEADRDREVVVDRESDRFRDYPARAILRGATKEQVENAPEFRYSVD